MSDATYTSHGPLVGNESSVSSVSWAAVIAGALAASAMSLALLMLGAGLGLVSVSPWSSSNVSGTPFGILAAGGFSAVQLFSSGLGGCLAGRLRTRWVSVHTDEVYFRDTAHGLLVWALGAVISASLLASAASTVVSGIARTGAATAQMAGTVAAGVAATATPSASSAMGYFT